MRLQWTDDLSVGVVEIDNQHKELFLRVNNLLDAMKQGRGKEEISGLIKFLGDYTIMHFGLEEEYMLRHEYPDYASHKLKHMHFTEEFSQARTAFETEGATPDLVVRISMLLTGWWIAHIRGVDKLLGIFLRKKL